MKSTNEYYFQKANSNKSLILILPLLSGFLAVAGCTSTIHRTDSFTSASGVQTLSIDAKQRVVIFATRDGKKISCAEPSPDALSAFSSNFGGSLQNNAGVAANLASSIAESAASIGLRTQSIQLLRDGMYRSCEAYAAGAINEEEFNRQQRRYQNLMLSLLAIEQISGAVVAKQVGLGAGKSTASVGENAKDAAAEQAQAEADLKSARTELDKLVAQRDADTKACGDTDKDKQKDAIVCKNADQNNKKVDDQKNIVSTAEMNLETAKLNLKAARAVITTSSTGATVSFDGSSQPSKMTEASAQYVAEAARTIVSTTLLASFAQEECTRLWDFITLTKVDTEEVKKVLVASGQNEQTITGSLETLAKSHNSRDIDDLARSIKLDQTQISKLKNAVTPPAVQQLRTLGFNDSDIVALVKDISSSCSSNVSAP